MALPLIAAAAAPIVSSVLGGIFNSNANNKNREWQLEDREWAVKYNEEQWNKQNAYNSPEQQMQRYRDAGLNPNLIYGQASNNVAQTARAEMPQRTPAMPWQAPDLLGAVHAYQNLKLGTAQVNNLGAQIENTNANTMVQTANAYKIAAETAKLTGADTDEVYARIRNLDSQTNERNTLLPYQQQASEARTAKDIADTKLSLTENELRIARTASDLRESVVRVLEYRARIANSEVERDKLRAEINHVNNSSELARLDIELKKKGIQPHDALWQRTVAEFANPKSSSPVKSMIDNAKKHYETKQRLDKFSKSYRDNHTFSFR